jgi:hypothetical protein
MERRFNAKDADMSNDAKTSHNVFTLFHAKTIDLSQLQQELERAAQIIENDLKQQTRYSSDFLQPKRAKHNPVAQLNPSKQPKNTPYHTSQSPLSFYHHPQNPGPVKSHDKPNNVTPFNRKP